MTFISKLLVLGLIAISSLAASDNAKFSRQRMLGDLDFIENTFLTCYAPLEFKKHHSGWDLEREIDTVREKVTAAAVPTLQEYQNLLGTFFNSPHDHHVAIEFYSTEIATLPFIARHTGDRYFITHIHSDGIDEKSPFPFAIGDELMLFDNAPVAHAIEEVLQTRFCANHGPTEHALAEIYLTTRLGRLGHQVPSGKIKLTGRKKGTSEIIDAEVAWSYYPEDVADIHAVAVKKMSRMAVTGARAKKWSFTTHPFFNKQLLMPHYEAFKQAHSHDDSPSDLIGSKMSYLPPLGKVVEGGPASEIFHAYLFELTDQRRAGYVRISAFKTHDNEQAVKEFAAIVEYFQREADVLVIDQVNNPGGLILYMYALTSMLTDKPLVVPQHRQMLTQEDVFFALNERSAYDNIVTDQDARDILGESLAGMPVTCELSHDLLKYYNFIIDEWNSGRKITELGNVYGIGPIMPHREVRFTKPILVLINGLDFSGADFFPAIMQDNQRATILGTRTAGAGGILGKTYFPNLNGIAEITYTTSLAVRPGNILIEEIGVTPDIFYEHSALDFQNNYSDYIEEIQRTLETLVQES